VPATHEVHEDLHDIAGLAGPADCASWSPGPSTPRSRCTWSMRLTDLGRDAFVPLAALLSWVEENIERFPALR
jgi:hypothetical protein